MLEKYIFSDWFLYYGGVYKMLDVDVLKTRILEDSNPMLTDAQLQMLIATYDNMNEACYYGCLMKATVAQKVTIGPISIEDNSNEFWLRMADGFYKKFLREQDSNGVSGLSWGRADEL